VVLCYRHLNDTDLINNLEKLSETEAIRTDALFWLSECYRRSRSYDKAETALRASIESTASDVERAGRIQSLVNLMLEMELPKDQIFGEVSKAFSNIKIKENQYHLFRALANIYEKYDDNFMQAIALEKALDLQPDNTDLRFDAAHAQSKAGISHLSVVNYETLIRQKPDSSGALNNLGVELDNLDMPIYSTRFYKKSADQMNSLAMANIAYRFINKGFVEEAENILKTAQNSENVSPNVQDAISALANKKEKENQKWEETIQNGIKQKAFLIHFAEAKFILDEKSKVFGKQWKYNEEIFDIEEKEGKLTAHWGTGSNRRKLTGEISGRSAKTNFFKQSSWITDREYFDSGIPSLCYVNNEGNKVLLMILEKDKPEFIDFELVQL
jgi:tetratricopeptide (TPR) repeat protein